MAIDDYKNFAYSTLANSPGTSGTSFVVQTGDGTKFPSVSFNATVWPSGQQPTGGVSGNAEIVRVTNISSDTLTVTRNAESGGATSIDVQAGYQIAATVTAKLFTDLEANYINSWSPAIAVSAGTGVQTLAANSSTTGTGNIFVFPMTIPFPIKFNQAIILQSNSYMTTNTAGSNTYWSNFGIYSMSSNSMSLISSSSFSFVDSNSGVSFTSNFPTSTATSGYGYGNGNLGNITAVAQGSSYVAGARKVGLQFGGEMSLSAGMYWLGILTYRSTTAGGQVSSVGFSHAGLIGQVINPINMAGSASGLMPLGMAPAEFAQSNVRISGWNGRFIMGFATNTQQAGFGGTRLPQQLELANLQTANTTGTVLPLVSLVST